MHSIKHNKSLKGTSFFVDAPEAEKHLFVVVCFMLKIMTCQQPIENDH